MAGKGQVTDLLLVVISFIVALASAVLVKNIVGNYGIAIIFLIVLFFILYAFAAMRGWTLPFTVRFVHSSLLSEVFLGLGVITSALAVSWFLGITISRAFSDVEGIFSGLVIFGVVMLAVSSARDWQ